MNICRESWDEYKITENDELASKREDVFVERIEIRESDECFMKAGNICRENWEGSQIL